MKHNVALDGFTIDRIVSQEMSYEISRLIRVLKWRRKGSQGGIFHHDTEKDCAEIKRHISAFTTVEAYFSEELSYKWIQ